MLAAHATFAESMAVVEASRGDQEKAIRQERELEAELSMRSLSTLRAS